MPGRMLIAALSLGVALSSAQSPPESGAEVQIILTAADHMNHRPASLNPSDITIVDAKVTGWEAVQNGQSLDLYIVIDDAANYYFGSKLGDLHRFIETQPETVAIGVAYIHDGVLQIAEKPTLDHQRAASALRPPSGGKVANPYCSVSDLVDGWHTRTAANRQLRREVLVVTSGADSSATGMAVCANAETAIRDAERAGIILYALYNPVQNYASQKWSDVDAGIVHLAHLSYETGGEAYFIGHGPSDSFTPFLDDITEHLAHQYLVRFRLPSGPESVFHPIHVNGKAADEELMVPAAVWVPAVTAVSGGN